MDLKYITPTNAKQSPLEVWQRNTNAMGYGDKIRTDYMVQVGCAARWYRVYAMCWSNIASHYVMVKGQQLFIHDYALRVSV
ncbi:hypothetical protein vBAspABolek_03 [Aeromonas phage vB_AspA_Bolek]|nr:hypothetical protein vBAspABolek_03 [Aeromonas phage vB_AspA_Bolek]